MRFAEFEQIATKVKYDYGIFFGYILEYDKFTADIGKERHTDSKTTICNTYFIDGVEVSHNVFIAMLGELVIEK